MDFVTTHVVSAVGITLVHFLWQGAAIGLVTAAVLATCPRAMARTRYGIAGAGLAAMTMAPLVTLGLVWQTAPAMTAGLPAFATEIQVQAGGGRFAGLPAALSPWLPVAVAVWALGVLALTTRLLVAWFRTERVRRRDVHPVSEALAAAVRRLARDIGIGRPIALFESRWVDVPTVIGWIRPTILLPIGALTGLSVQQIEAVLSHELAHIKRHDYLINVLQNFAETVFFYHPAVWWLSKQIRVEREHCCDDVAVEACGNPLLYARALAALEESRQRNATFALAATDGSLVERVRRLVGPVHDDRREPSLPIAACVAVILAVVALGAAQAQGANGSSVTDEPQTPLARVALQAGSAAAPTASERASADVPQEVTPESAVPYARIDAETIRVDGETYRRGSAEDLRRALASRASAQRDAAVASSSDAQEVAPEAPGVLRVGGAIKEPRKIRHVSPAYPQAARDAGISGVVILEATIDTDGLPVGIRILRSIPDLDQAAINAVRQWRYEPTLLNGEPVPVAMTVTVNFTLQTSAQQQEAFERRLVELTRLLEQDALRGAADPTDTRDRALELEELERFRLRLQQMATARAAARAREAAENMRSTTVTATSPNPAAGTAAPLRIGGPIREPRKIHNVNPVYPKIAQASNVSGIVILDIIVSATGDVTDVSILRSIPMLDMAAIEAVRQWRYEPTLLNGVPTPVQMTVTVNFTLN